MFTLTPRLTQCWYPPTEFLLCVVWGPLGYGKSSWQFKVTVELLQRIYKIDPETAWELLPRFIVFHPEQFFSKLREIRKIGQKRIPVLNWDDAGLWLYALEWNDPFLIKVGKWMSVARRRLGSLLLSAPTPERVFKKIRAFPQSILTQVIKTTGSHRGKDLWRRRAKHYVQYYNIIKGYRKTRMKMGGSPCEDDYICKLPDDFYSWYEPLSSAYEDMALDLMESEWEDRRQTKLGEFNLKDYPSLKVPKLEIRDLI